jgi:hypothetical protein
VEEVKMKKLLIIAFTFISSIGLASINNADEVMKKAHLAAYYYGEDGSAQLLMKVYPAKSNNPIKKMFYMLRLDLEEGGRQMFYTYFQSPSDIKKTTFLVHKEIEKDDFRRLYIPASDKVIPIAGGRKQDPFMGSNFTYEDVSGRHYTKDNHKILGEGKALGYDCIITESTPKVKEDKILKIKYWVEKKNYIPVKVEFYDHNGKVYRTYESEKIMNLSGYPTIVKRVMKASDGSRTEILVNPKSVKYNLGLNKNIFSVRSLKVPPYKYIK